MARRRRFFPVTYFLKKLRNMKHLRHHIFYISLEETLFISQNMKRDLAVPGNLMFLRKSSFQPRYCTVLASKFLPTVLYKFRDSNTTIRPHEISRKTGMRFPLASDSSMAKIKRLNGIWKRQLCQRHQFVVYHSSVLHKVPI